MQLYTGCGNQPSSAFTQTGIEFSSESAYTGGMMKKANYYLLTAILCVALGCMGCGGSGQDSAVTAAENPLLQDFETPFGVPPFGEIENEHFLPAFKAAIARHEQEIKTIVDNPEDATFENTLAALDHSGKLLDRVSSIYYNLKSSHTNDALQQMGGEVASLMANHYTGISLNMPLFQRVKAVYGEKEDLELNRESQRLLEKIYRDFVRGGANLEGTQRDRYREINEELARLTTEFDDHVLEATNRYRLVVEEEADLSGLPAGVIAGARERAADDGLQGKWVFTTSKSNMIPFLTFADNRELRQKLLTAHQTRCNHDDDLDNKDILEKIINLRVEQAGLLGYPTHAHYVLEENMAKEPGRVYELLDQVWNPALETAKKERDILQQMLEKDIAGAKLEPWDWWFYTEKLRKDRFDLDDREIKPYFALGNVRNGAFTVVNRLFGITFKERPDLPVYHQDVSVFEVLDQDGSHLGILYFDPFSRPTKGGGAWMSTFRQQSMENGERISPVVTVNYKFPRGNEDTPCLLDMDQTLTLFHELGHALHGLLSDCRYQILAGTNVATDFVELPSQMMEHWAMHPDVLKIYARDYRSGKPIPSHLVDKMEKASLFNQGFITVEYMAAVYLDMAFHTLGEKTELKINEFETRAMERIGLIPEIVVRYRSTYFSHITGGYSAGYYSYLWSEVLDCDAFEAFKQNGLFDKETASALREYIYSKGASEDPMVLYKSFRGSEPTIRPLLEKRGLL
jgi:peptidyl-dipeptidase Dcp